MESPIRKLFWDNVPRKLLRNVLRVMFQSYRDAHAYCYSHHEQSEAVNLVPFVRRKH